MIAYEDFISYGSESKVKEAGKMRVEGKEYVVKDGDIMHFRFNVWGRFLRVGFRFLGELIIEH